MSRDGFGDTLTAIRTARNQNLTSGPLNGAMPPILMPGKMLMPPHVRIGAAATTTTALSGSVYYIIPFSVPRTTTFAGVKCFNTGAGDNTKVIKIAFYNEAAAGGPGTLAKDFGIITLSGAAAIRTLATSWTAAGPAWYYGALVASSTPSLSSFASFVWDSSNTISAFHDGAHQVGSFAADALGAVFLQGYIGDTVNGTYANFPEATSLTPTASVWLQQNSGSGGSFPAFGLYV